MDSHTPPIPSPETQAMLACLRQAVAQALERKRRLGQYAIVWMDNAPAAIGEDAPPHLKMPEQPGST